MLLELSQFSPFVPIHPASPTPSGNPPTIGHIHGSCIQVLWLLHLLYCTLHPHGYSITTYLHFLIPSPPHPFPHTLLPSGNHQNPLCIRDSVSSLLVCLNLVFQIQWFIGMYLFFIVHSFDLLFLK